MDNYYKAVEYYNSGQSELAKQILKKVCKKNPRDFDALNFLGIISFNEEEYETAINNFNKVTKIYSKHSDAFYNLALCYQVKGQTNNAEKNYKKTLQINPKHFGALNGIGVISFEKGEYEKAEKFYHKALAQNVDDCNLFNNVGNLLLIKKEYEDAEQYFIKAVQLQPSNDIFYYNLGRCYRYQEKYHDALQCFTQAVKLNNDNNDALDNIAMTSISMEKFEEAEKIIDLIFQRNPKSIIANFCSAFINQQKGNNELAIKYYQEVLNINPQYSDLLTNIGNIYGIQGDYNEAEKFIRASLTQNASQAIALTSLAVAQFYQNKLDEAESILRESLKIDCNIVETHFNLGVVLLKKSNFKEGWKEYDWRLKNKKIRDLKFPGERLTDQDVDGKRILVIDEQGAGDTIQFVRLVKELKSRGAYVLLKVEDNLLELISSFKGFDEIFGSNKLPQVECDYNIPLMSLPGYLNINLENTQGEVPYLNVDDSKLSHWKNELMVDKIKVGLVWAGNPNHANDLNRSCKFSNYQELLDLDNIQFYSLQKGTARDQIKDLSDSVIDLSAKLHTYADTAAAISNLDLVISVDTSVAHLAGAIGIKVFTLLPYAGEWRWLYGRDDVPWYPSMKLFRQPDQNDWNTVIKNVKKQLLNL